MQRYLSLVTRHLSLCIAALAAFAASAATTYTWQNTDGTGVLNTPDNWSPALGPFVANDVHLIPLPADGTGAAFQLDGALTSSIFRVTGGMAGGAPVVFDLGGHTLLSQKSGNTGWLDLFTGSPLVFRDGAINAQFYLRLGIDGSRDTPFRAAFTNVALAHPPYTTRYANSLSMSFTDCAVTNFPNNNPASNTRYDFDHSIYSLAADRAHFTPVVGATNVVYRFVNGTTFGRVNTDFCFGSNAIVTNCHYSFESGTELPYRFALNGAFNAIGFTNATMTGKLEINGSDSFVNFHDAIITNYPASGTIINNLNGTRNALLFNGTTTKAYMQYLDLGGSGYGNRLIFGEGLLFTNQFAYLRLNGGHGHTVRVDPGAAISPTINCSVPDCTVVFTNATLRGIFATTAERCRINFHDSCISNRPPTSYVISTFNGRDGCVSFTGSKAVFWMNYMDLGGVSNRMEFADGIIATNAPFAFRFSSYARDCTIDLGAGAQLLIGRFTFDYTAGRNTNVVVRLGKGARVTCLSSCAMGAEAIRGVGSRLVLDDAEFLSQGTSGGEVIEGGGSVEFLGDEAKFTCSPARGASGWLQLGNSLGEGMPPLTMLFRPGATGYHGVPPVSINTPYYSYIRPTVVFDVDATAFARGKPGGTYDIPLIRKGGQCAWVIGAPDLDALNAIGVFTPANGRLAFDDDDNLVFRFKRDVGTRLLVR